MKKALKIDITIALFITLFAQLIFFFYSPNFTEVSYTNRIFATTGVRHEQEDLQKLNEAAHFFGETMIGWLKFPSLMADLHDAVDLPEGSAISAQLQERQNIIFVLSTPTSLELDKLIETKNFLQSKIDAYNEVGQTKFILTNFDYDQVKNQRSYQFGAIVIFIASLVFAVTWSFVRREFKVY